MCDLHEIVAEIISELARIQKLPSPYRDKDDDFQLPRLLGVGNGGFISISKKIDQLIGDVARTMRTTSSLQSSFTAEDYRTLVRRVFGPALSKIDLGAERTQSAQAVLADVKANVSKEIEWILNSGGLEYAFGCTLFVYKDFAPFDIGPVRFEPRDAWLER